MAHIERAGSCSGWFTGVESEAMDAIGKWNGRMSVVINGFKVPRGPEWYPVPGGITGTPCSWGTQIREPGPTGWGNLRWDSKVWLRVLCYSDYWVIALQTADPFSRQRGRPTETRPQPTGSNIWSQVPERARHQNILTVSREVTSTSHHGIWDYVQCMKRGMLWNHQECTMSDVQNITVNIPKV
jgi:hypothetical protein